MFKRNNLNFSDWRFFSFAWDAYKCPDPIPFQKQILIQIRSRKRNTCLSDPVDKEDEIAKPGAKDTHAIPLLQLVKIRPVVLVYGSPVL